MKLGVILLAAGASRRMGQPKLLLAWGKTSILGHLITVWKQLKAEQIAVVHAAGDMKLQEELERLGFAADQRIVNPAPERGMFSSIQCAAAWTGWKKELTHFAIVLGDQPHLRLNTLRTLLDFAAAHPRRMCQPGRNGRARHPVILPKDIFEQLPNAPVSDLKQFLESRKEAVILCEITDPGLDLDIDRPEDYEKARAQWRECNLP